MSLNKYLALLFIKRYILRTDCKQLLVNNLGMTLTLSVLAWYNTPHFRTIWNLLIWSTA